MLTKMYQIQVKRSGGYVPLDDIEYTEQEVNKKWLNDGNRTESWI